tara:strand:- start:572 stop:958 length:387 start_codon:yes stop_codon:yes gene_type:complete
MSQKKIMYWHPIVKGLIEKGLMPKEINRVLAEIFPKNDIGTRKIGAYKRRCVDEGLDIVQSNEMISMENAITWARENIDKDDIWIHDLVINSAMAELRIFAFKTSEEESDEEQTEMDKFEEWMNGRIL